MGIVALKNSLILSFIPFSGFIEILASITGIVLGILEKNRRDLEKYLLMDYFANYFSRFIIDFLGSLLGVATIVSTSS